MRLRNVQCETMKIVNTLWVHSPNCAIIYLFIRIPAPTWLDSLGNGKLNGAPGLTHLGYCFCLPSSEPPTTNLPFVDCFDELFGHRSILASLSRVDRTQKQTNEQSYSHNAIHLAENDTNATQFRVSRSIKGFPQEQWQFSLKRDYHYYSLPGATDLSLPLCFPF